MTKSKIVYIAGYGRSGSTLLDTILSFHPQLEGVGEIKFLFQEVLDQKELPQIWEMVIDNFEKQTPYTVAEANKITRQVQHPFILASKRSKIAYRKIWSNILDSLHAQLPGATIVDSSKSAFDAFYRPRLLREMGYEVLMIHLIRSPKAVMFSLGRKGSNRLLEKGKEGRAAVLFGGSIRALINWTLINLGVFFYYKRYPKIVLKYEDLVNNTSESLQEIADFIGVEATPFQAVKEGFEVAPGIGVSGNRMRRSSTITFRKNTAPDYSFSLLEELGLFLIKPVRKLFKYS